MQETIKKNYFLSMILLCGFITAVKLLALYFSNVPLWVDEAQYWGWSKELAAGYFSKPPLIAWLIHDTTNIFGNSEFGIRVSAPVLHYFTAIFVYLIAANLIDKRTAFYSALVYITLPGVALSSTFISTDVPLMFFWAASLYFLLILTKFQEGKALAMCLAYAVCVGLGLLSKYTMAAFVLMSFYHIYAVRKGKRFFKLDFWIANVIAFLIFVPNLYWNYNNHFISFIHTQENVISGKSGGGLKLADMFEFLGGQLLVFGIALVFFVMALLDKNERENNNRTLLLFSIPLLVVGILISLISGAQAHWAAATYIAASIVVVSFILRKERFKWLKIILIFNAVVYTLCLDLNIPASIARVKKDPLERVTMWYKLQEPLKKIEEQYPDVQIVSDERKIIATTMYALKDAKGNPKVIYKWNPEGYTRDHYELTRSFDINMDMEKPIIFISKADVSEYMSDIYFNIDRLKTADEEFPFYIFLLKGKR